MAAAKRKVVLAYPWTEVRRDEDGRRIDPVAHRAGTTVSVDDVTARALIRDGIGRAPDEVAPDDGAGGAGDDSGAGGAGEDSGAGGAGEDAGTAGSGKKGGRS